MTPWPGLRWGGPRARRPPDTAGWRSSTHSDATDASPPYTWRTRSDVGTADRPTSGFTEVLVEGVDTTAHHRHGVVHALRGVELGQNSMRAPVRPPAPVHGRRRDPFGHPVQIVRAESVATDEDQHAGGAAASVHAMCQRVAAFQGVLQGQRGVRFGHGVSRWDGGCVRRPDGRAATARVPNPHTWW